MSLNVTSSSGSAPVERREPPAAQTFTLAQARADSTPATAPFVPPPEGRAFAPDTLPAGYRAVVGPLQPADEPNGRAGHTIEIVAPDGRRWPVGWTQAGSQVDPHKWREAAWVGVDALGGTPVGPRPSLSDPANPHEIIVTADPETTPETDPETEGEVDIELVVTAPRARPSTSDVLGSLATLDPQTGEQTAGGSLLDQARRLGITGNPDPNQQTITAADPNRPAYTPRPALDWVDPRVAGFVTEQAGALPGLTTLAGQALNWVTGGRAPGLENAGRAWQQTVDDYYTGPEGVFRHLDQSVGFEDGRMLSRVFDLATLSAESALLTTTRAGRALNAADTAADALNAAPTPPRTLTTTDPSGQIVQDSFTLSRPTQGRTTPQPTPATDPTLAFPQGASGSNTGINLRPDHGGGLDPSVRRAIQNSNPTTSGLPTSARSDLLDAVNAARPQGTAPIISLETPPVTRRNAAYDAARMGVLPPREPGNLTIRHANDSSSLPETTTPVPTGVLTPAVRADMTNRVNDFLAGSSRVPDNVADTLQPTVLAEATRRAGSARTPEAALARVDSYLAELQNQPQTLSLMVDRADRARRATVDKAIDTFAREQNWPNAERGPVVAQLRRDLNGLSVADANQSLRNIAADPYQVRRLSARAGVSPPPEPTPANPLDSINLLNDRRRINVTQADNPPLAPRQEVLPDTAGGGFDSTTSTFGNGNQPVTFGFGSEPLLPEFSPSSISVAPQSTLGRAGNLLETGLTAGEFGLTHPLQTLRAGLGGMADLSRAEQQVVRNVQNAAGTAFNDAVRFVTPDPLLNAASGGTRAFEGTLDLGNRFWNAVVVRPLQGATNLAPQPVREFTTGIVDAGVRGANSFYNVWNGDVATGLRSLALHGIAVGTATQIPTMQFEAGIVGTDPDLQTYADLHYLAPGTAVAFGRLSPDNGSLFEGYFGVQAAVGGPDAGGALDIREKAPFRFQVGQGGNMAFIGTGFAAPFQFGYSASVGLDPETIGALRMSVGQTARVPVFGWNPPFTIGNKPLPYGQTGNQLALGAQAVVGTNDDLTSSNFYTMLGPIGIGSRSPWSTPVVESVFSTNANQNVGASANNNFVILGNPTYTSSNPQTLQQLQDVYDSLPAPVQWAHDRAADMFIPRGINGWHERDQILGNTTPTPAPQQAPAPGTPAANTPAPSFGATSAVTVPELGRVEIGQNAQGDPAIRLDSGKVYVIPAQIDASDANAVQGWVERSRALGYIKP